MDSYSISATPSIGLGYTFFLPGDSHLWFVASDPTATDVVILNMTTSRFGTDSSCEFDAGEHPFVKHKTCIAWNRAIVTTLELIQRGVVTGQITPYGSPITNQLLVRVWDGADRARSRLKERVRLIFLEQALIPK